MADLPSASGAGCCERFMRQMVGDVLGDRCLRLYWPVNPLHWAIYLCFFVSLTYSFLWASRFSQAQCGKYRIIGGSIANCSFEIVGFLVYVWMTWLSLKLIWYYDDVKDTRQNQLKASFLRSIVGILDTLKSAQRTIDGLRNSIMKVQENGKLAQVQLAVNMLRQCVRHNIQFPEEATVQYLYTLYLAESADASKAAKNSLRANLRNLNNPELTGSITSDILQSWAEYHERKEKAFKEWQKDSWIQIETAHSSEDARKLGEILEMKSMRLYFQKADTPLEEIDIDNAYCTTRKEELPGFLSAEWEKHSRDLGAEQPTRGMPPLAFYALVSKRSSVGVQFAPLPTCTCEFPKCCFPSICYCFLRCFQSLRCAFQGNQLQLPLVRPDYENRMCSLGFCSLKLVSPLQEQLLTTLAFAGVFFVFNLSNVLVGVLDGCPVDPPVPCGVLLVQRTVGVLCTLIFIASTIECLRERNFKRLDPVISMFEMAAGLEKVARQADNFKEGLGSVDELSRKVLQSEEAKKGPSGFITKFSDSESRGDRDEMETYAQQFLIAMGHVNGVQ